MNELIFLTQVIFISCSTLGALYWGKEALISLICLQCVLANVFVLKEITLLNLTATGSDAFTVGIVLGLNLLQEYYGRTIARTTIWLSFALLIFYILVSSIHLQYIPAVTDTMQPHYGALFGHMPRIMLASLFVYLVVQLFDTALFARLNQWFGGKYLPVRVVISLSISQLLDTVLFSYLGLYGIISNIMHIIIISYTIKLTSILLSSPFVALTKIIKKPTIIPLIMVTLLGTSIATQAQPTPALTYRKKNQAITAALNKQIAYTTGASLIALGAGLYLKNDILRGIGIGGAFGSATYALQGNHWILAWLTSLWGQKYLDNKLCCTNPQNIPLTHHEIRIIEKKCRERAAAPDLKNNLKISLTYDDVLEDLVKEQYVQQDIADMQHIYRHVKSRIPIILSSCIASCATYFWLRYMHKKIEKEINTKPYIRDSL